MADSRNSYGYVDNPPALITENGAIPHKVKKKGGFGKLGLISILVFMLVVSALSVAAVILAGDRLLENLNGDDDSGDGGNNGVTPAPTNSPTFNPTSSPITSAPTTGTPTQSPTPPTVSPTLDPTLSPTNSPTLSPTLTQLQFLGTPETVFQDQPGDLLSIIFTQEVSVVPEIVLAFRNAARRWSDVLAGTDFGIFQFGAGEELCPGIAGSDFIATQVITSLHIVAQFANIDGVGLILGSAGPCFFALATQRTVTGQMLFDTSDVFALIDDGSFESVVLHEMGHVLGIGTSWSDFELLQNPVFPVEGPINLNLQPGFIGLLAIQEYRDLVANPNETFVPVEDGVFRGVEQFNRADGAGRGSIDGHWDKDFFQGELMEFQIAPGSVPPMSRTTIASLGDLGYNINLTLAEDYTPPSPLNAKLRGSKVKTHSMIGDIDLSYLKFI